MRGSYNARFGAKIIEFDFQSYGRKSLCVDDFDDAGGFLKNKTNLVIPNVIQKLAFQEGYNGFSKRIYSCRSC